MKMICVIVMCVMGAFFGGCSSAKQYRGYESAPAAYAGPDQLYGGGVRGDSVQTVSVESDDGSRWASRKQSDKIKGKTQQGAPQPNIERKLVRNARLTLEVRDEDDFKPTIEKLGKMAESMGGYVQVESSESTTLFVPTQRLDEAILQVEKLGEVTARNISVVDATANYVDMQIRIDNLQKMRARLTELVNQSTSVKEVLEVERELARVTSELERLEGQLRVLDRDTTYATLYISLDKRVRPGPLGWVFYGGYRVVRWLFIWD